MAAPNGLATLPLATDHAIVFELVGQIIGGAEDDPSCPRCGGYLDRSQPDADDEASAQIGLCVECGKLAMLIEAKADLRVVVPLPSREEALIKLLDATQLA